MDIYFGALDSFAPKSFKKIIKSDPHIVTIKQLDLVFC